eukprot:tig00020614_g12144.t1
MADLEHSLDYVLLRIHVRATRAILRYVTPAMMDLVLHFSFFIAVTLVCVLLELHLTFVGQPSCLAEKLPPEVRADIHVLRIKIRSTWSTIANKIDHLVREVHAESQGSASGSGEPAGRPPAKPPEGGDPQAAEAARLPMQGSLEGIIRRFVRGLDESEILSLEPAYEFSLEKGFLLTSPVARARHNITMAEVDLESDDACLGNKGLRFLVEHLVGYDTIVTNAMLSLYGGRGYLLTTRGSRELYDLNYAAELDAAKGTLLDYFALKAGVFLTSAFLLVTSCTLVSFCFREAQLRILRFALTLQGHLRERRPVGPLVAAHVLESLVFVPIVIGVVFFLMEFTDDQLLAFLAITAVWGAEIFALVAVRTPTSMAFFPKFFCIYHALFYMYFFSFPFGFTYVAFAASAALLVHAGLFFWSRYEAAAVASGAVSLLRPRPGGPPEDSRPLPPRPEAPIRGNLSASSLSEAESSEGGPLAARAAGTAPGEGLRHRHPRPAPPSPAPRERPEGSPEPRWSLAPAGGAPPRPDPDLSQASPSPPRGRGTLSAGSLHRGYRTPSGASLVMYGGYGGHSPLDGRSSPDSEPLSSGEGPGQAPAGEPPSGDLPPWR